jgi:transposase
MDELERIVAMQATIIVSRDHALAERDAEITQLKIVIQAQAEEIAALKAKLNTNSKNSSKPPSTDPPWVEPTKKGGKGKRKKGAQAGHTGAARELLPVEEVDAVVPCLPVTVCGCGGNIIIDESNPERKQVIEIPEIKPHVTEFQIFGGCCADCDAKIRGVVPEGTPAGMLGPRALATIAFLTGKFSLSKRDIEELFCDYFGLPISLGTVCNAEQIVADALKGPYEEVVAAIKNEPVVHADETSHKIAGKRGWIWLALSLTMAVFFARASRSKKVALEILGENFGGILVSDRYPGYLWVQRRQFCWAHLCRDFQKLVDFGGAAALFASPILDYITEMFVLWHKFKDGEITRAELQEQIKPLCDAMEQRLEAGKTVLLAEALCENLCKRKSALWMFIHHEQVEPTNNEAERTVRQYVIWRKTSFGTQGERGNRFVERILTAVGTCKRQNLKVFEYLTEAVTAHLQGVAVPSLIHA